jgi:hypothetical protein
MKKNEVLKVISAMVDLLFWIVWLSSSNNGTNNGTKSVIFMLVSVLISLSVLILSIKFREDKS